MFGFNHGNEMVCRCSTRLTAGSSIGVGMFVVLVFTCEDNTLKKTIDNG